MCDAVLRIWCHQYQDLLEQENSKYRALQVINTVTWVNAEWCPLLCTWHAWQLRLGTMRSVAIKGLPTRKQSKRVTQGGGPGQQAWPARFTRPCRHCQPQTTGPLLAAHDEMETRWCIIQEWKMNYHFQWGPRQQEE